MIFVVRYPWSDLLMLIILVEEVHPYSEYFQSKVEQVSQGVVVMVILKDHGGGSSFHSS